MRAVRAPGRDRPPTSRSDSANFQPGSGAGGVFATYMQGQTPKYAINNGLRADLYRNSLVRMFIRVDAEEMDFFRASVADSHTQRNLVSRIAGDPRRPPPRGRTAGASDPTVRRNANVYSNGYLDFFINQAQMPLREKVQVSETLSDNYVLFAFGQSPPVWNFSGFLLNTVQDDQASNMFRLYTQILRATQMARRQKVMSLSMDSYVITGVMQNLDMALSATSEVSMPFGFSMIVKRVSVVNYTAGWTPTRASTGFAADLNAIPYDGRPRELLSLTRITARAPEGTALQGPVPTANADPRTGRATILDFGLVDPVVSTPGSGVLLPQAPVSTAASPASGALSPHRPESFDFNSNSQQGRGPLR